MALGAGQAGAADGEFAICHSSGGTAPAGGDTGDRDKLPCPLCAVAVASGGLVPVQAVAPELPRVLAGKVEVLAPVFIPTAAPARAGLSRAPPRFA